MLMTLINTLMTRSSFLFFLHSFIISCIISYIKHSMNDFNISTIHVTKRHRCALNFLFFILYKNQVYKSIAISII